MKTRKSLLYLLVLLTTIGCTTHRESDIVKTADSLLWADPDSCLMYLENAPKTTSKAEEKHRELIRQHAYFRINGELESDSILSDLVSYFTQHGDYEAAGEANYIIGGSHVQKGEYFEATSYLKDAESLYQRGEICKPQLMGLLYLNLGNASEQCRLYHIAAEYCQQAIPYLKTYGNITYLTMCYHIMGKSQDNQDSAVIYLDSALYYANIMDDKSYYMEIEISRNSIINHKERMNLQTLSYLSDSCHLYFYAAFIVDYYIENNNLGKACEYMETLALDTSTNIWSKEQYYVLQSELYCAQNMHVEAYNIIKDLLIRQTAEIENSAYASTYIISQRYDAVKEQELRLQETVKKQRAYIGIIVVLLLCFVIGGAAYYIYKRSAFRIQLSEAEQKRLAQELEANRRVLRTRISERLEVARQLRVWESQNSESVPEAVNMLLPRRVKHEQEMWQEFYDEFNLCYNNALQKLRDMHPELNNPDLQYIALDYLGFDMTDKSFLLGVEKRTMWNRRNSIRKHLGMSEDADLDGWINSEMGDVQSISPPKLCTSGA